MTDPTGGPNAEPNENAAEAQPTQAYPPADAQPTQAYPPADQPATAAPEQPAYAAEQPAYVPAGTPAYPAATTATDARPKGLAITGLVLGIVGIVIALLGFIPIAGIGFSVFGGIVLLAGLIVSIIAIASKKQGGRGMSLTGLILSIVGLVLGTIALVVQLAFIAAIVSHSDSAEGTDTSQSAPLASDSPGSTTDDSASGSYDEQAYLDEVRPALLSVMQGISPDITKEQLADIYSDDTLVTMGKTLAALPKGAQDAARSSFVTSAVQASNNLLDDATAGDLFDVISQAAAKHLQK